MNHTIVSLHHSLKWLFSHAIIKIYLHHDYINLLDYFPYLK